MTRLFSIENIIYEFSRKTLVVAEGVDPVLQQLTVEGKYYVIEVWDKYGKMGLVSYRKNPKGFPRFFAEHPYPNRESAEADADRLRDAQRRRAMEASSNESVHNPNYS